MIISRVYLKGFKNFKEEISFKFDKINLIQGENGSGKSTLAIDSLLFAMFGYSSQTLEKLVTRSIKKKECKVRIEVEDRGKKIIVERTYPTSLSIFEDGIKIDFDNTKETQIYLNRLFNSLEWFRKFRMVDSKEGINILEEGKTSIKKTLLSLQEDWFNDIRQKLLYKKSERENYNKDKCIWKHSPSENRLKILKTAIQDLNAEFINTSKEHVNQANIINKIVYNIGKINGEIDTYSSKLSRINNLEFCPTCTQSISEELKENVKNDLQSTKLRCIIGVAPLESSLVLEREILKEIEKTRTIILSKLEKVKELKDRLETAIKQKDYKYTKKDVLVIDKCIKELDNFYGYFITEWIRTLEPIINSILDKIGFKISFENDFDLVLSKDGEEYSYKDLSTGQRLILSIALKLAILLERNERGLLIADEGLSSLDATNLDYIIKLFNDLPFQLIAIIHRFSIEEDRINIISL